MDVHLVQYCNLSPITGSCRWQLFGLNHQPVIKVNAVGQVLHSFHDAQPERERERRGRPTGRVYKQPIFDLEIHVICIGGPWKVTVTARKLDRAGHPQQPVIIPSSSPKLSVRLCFARWRPRNKTRRAYQQATRSTQICHIPLNLIELTTSESTRNKS